MLDTLAGLMAPYYLQLKFVHLLFVAMWFWSTSVAYSYYLVPLFRAWQSNPAEPDRVALRNWAMERFDDGAILEHVAFPVVLVTGLALMLVTGYTPAAGWFAMKLCFVVLIFIPIEVMDYYLAHFGGNKEHIRTSGNLADYEPAIRRHWLFLVISTPVVIVTISYTLYLAIVKPF